MPADISAWLNAGTIGAFGTLLGGLGMWWKGRRDARLADRKDGREAKRDDVEVIQSWMEIAKDSAEEAAAARKEAAQTRMELRSMRIDVDSLLDRVEALDGDLGHVLGYITLVIEGVDAGTVPPLPPMPPPVATLIQQEKGKERP